MPVTIVRTLTGSVYFLRQDAAGAWWLHGRNRPNPTSVPLGERWWAVGRPQPWPPVRGQSLFIPARHPPEPAHPDRPPGGGKFTSPVIALDELADDQPPTTAPACTICGGRLGVWTVAPAVVGTADGALPVELPLRRCDDCGHTWVTARGPAESAPTIDVDPPQ